MTILIHLKREKQKARNFLFHFSFSYLFLKFHLNHTALFFKWKTNKSVIVIQFHTLINSSKN